MIGVIAPVAAARTGAPCEGFPALAEKCAILYDRSPEAVATNDQTLLGHGADPATLARFRARTSKKSDAAVRPQCLDEAIADAIDAGGMLAGGYALAVVTGKFTPGDADVFFEDPVAWALFVLQTYDVTGIDACVCIGLPWSSFDLQVTECAFSEGDRVIMSDGCSEALGGGICGINHENTVFPALTIGRMMKYADRLGTRYDPVDVLRLLARANMPHEDEAAAVARLIG